MAWRIITVRHVVRISVWTCAALIGLAASFALLIVGLFYVAMPWHDLTLWRAERTLASFIAHPSNSHAIERKTFFGSRYTDISECTYVVGEFRSSSLSRDEILRAYKGRSTGFFSFAPNIPVHMVIIEKDTSLPLDNPADGWITNFQQNINKNKSDTTYYLVYLYEKGKPWWGDIRCHE